MRNKLEKIIVASSIILIFFIAFNYQSSVIDQNRGKEESRLTNRMSEHLLSALSSNASNTYQISNTTEATYPQIATDGNMDIHIVWADQHDGDYDILYRKFTYSTQTWSSITNLSDYDTFGQSVDQTSPSIAIDEYNNIMVAWIDRDINDAVHGRYYNSSLSTWTGRTTIRVGFSSASIYDLELTNSTGGNFTVVYARALSGTTKINYQYFDRVNQWSAGIEMTTPPGVQDTRPSIFYDKNNKGHLVFRRYQNSIYSIMYCNRTLDPQDFTYKFGIDATGQQVRLLNVTKNLGYGLYTYQANNPDVISIPENNMIHVAWQDKWNSSSIDNQIRLANLTLTNHIEDSILNSNIMNVTASNLDRQNPRLGLGFSSLTLSMIWNDEQSDGRVILKKTLSSAEVVFDHDSINSVPVSVSSDLAYDKHNSLYIVYTAGRTVGAPRQIWFRQYDVWNPQISFINPLNYTVTQGNVSLEVMTEPDTKSVKYEYFVDLNGNGLDDDAGSWTLIRQVLSTTNDFDTEWNTTENGPKDYRNILIKATAVDINGVDDIEIKGHIIIDNHIPQMVRLVSIWDDSGHYNSSTTVGTVYFCNTTSFNFDVFDNCSGIDFVRLYNGLVEIETNATAGNNTAIILDTSTGNYDGTYDDLFITAYDRILNENSSIVITPTVIIDNQKPIGIYSGLVENGEYSRNLGLNLTTVESDTKSVQYYYRKSTDPPGVYTNIGTATFTSGAWRRTWNTVGVSDGNYIIRAVITDNTGWVNITEIDISIDNTAPSPVIVSPTLGQEIGARILFNVSCDLDTVQMYYYNCSANPTNDGSYKLINSTTYYTQDNQHRYFHVYFDALYLPAGQHYLKVMAVDNQNFKTNTTYIGVFITNKYPRIVQYFSANSVFNSLTKSYDITLSWTTPTSFLNITSYAIFRVKDNPLLFSLESIQNINAMTPIAKFDYLGNMEGEKYFVKEYEVNQIYDNTPRAYTWTDTGLSASNYYYVILTVNVYQNPSNCSSTVTVNIAPENPTRGGNFLEVEFLPILGLIYAGVLAALTVISVKSSKSKQIRKDTKVKLDTMYEEKFSKEGEKTFEQRMDEMTSIAETKVEEKIAPSVKDIITEPVKKTKEDNFLDMKVTSEEVKTTEAEGPRRCPNCNWIISSKAFKCPRCGKAV